MSYQIPEDKIRLVVRALRRAADIYSRERQVALDIGFRARAVHLAIKAADLRGIAFDMELGQGERG